MCAKILKDYMMDTDQLREFDLKTTLFKYLLPYATILPIFSNLSNSLIIEFKHALNSRRFNGYIIGFDLFEELIHLSEYYKRLLRIFGFISKFFISGGFILYLLNQINNFNDIDIYVESVDFFFHVFVMNT